RDEHFRAGDQFVATGVVLAKPRFVKPEPIQRDDTFHVVFQCHRWGLPNRVKRCDKDTETQWHAHCSSNPLRNSNRVAFTSSGRSCCSQCPAPSIITWR